jgi:carotenoid cleavage dioxygenase-like enzyme
MLIGVDTESMLRSPASLLIQSSRLMLRTGRLRFGPRELMEYLRSRFFLARPGGRGEDDGVLLLVLLDTSREQSALVVLDAQSMTEVGRAE